MNFEQRHLPDYCFKQRDMEDITGIIIHYFSGRYAFPDEPFNEDKCYDLFLDLNSTGQNRGRVLEKDSSSRMWASAHYMITREGKVVELVESSKIAWHAGRSELNGRTGCNDFTIGIEMIATHDSGYTDEQYYALAELSATLITKYPTIIKENITGHEHVGIPAGRKKDPGPLFDWSRYNQMIEGVFPPA